MTNSAIRKILAGIVVSITTACGIAWCTPAPKTMENSILHAKTQEEKRNEYWEEKFPESMKVVTKKLEDGREVTCIVSDGFKERTMSCDWEGAR